MSIATAIASAQGKVADCYTAISNKGGTLPATQNLANMPTAIGSIQTGGTINSLTITPTTSQQIITASGSVDGYSPITVNAVTNSIDANITPSHIKSGVSILGVNGVLTPLIGETRSVSITSTAGNTFTPTSGNNGITSITVTPTNQAKTITPTTSSQSISVPSGYSGFGTLTVNAVTSSIDANITAGNIKDGVSILGVTGTYSGGGGGSSLSSIFDSNYFVSSNGTITNYISFSDQSSVSHKYILKPFATSFANSSTIHNWLDETLSEVNSSITGIKSITKIGNLIKNPNSTSLLLNEDTSTEYISFRALKEAVFTTTKQFKFLTVLKKVDLHNAEKIALPSSFAGLSSFEAIDLSSAEDLTTARALGGTASIGGAFAGTSITTVSLPALKSTSFGSATNQFDYMLKNVTGCTVHFPSNLQSVIGSWTSVTSGFGGTNTTVLFDLPATS